MLAEWIFGDDADGNQYLTHTKFPRFIARLDDEEGFSSGINLVLSDGEVLGDIMWIDQVDKDNYVYLDALREAASAALDRHDQAVADDMNDDDSDD